MDTASQPVPLYGNIRVSLTTLNPFSASSEPAYQIEFDVLGQPGFKVTLPESDFDPNNAQQAVEDVAMRIAAVMGMEGPQITFDAGGKPMAPAQLYDAATG